MNKEKKSTFKIGTLIYSGVLVLLVLVSQIILWTFLSSYQKSLPETSAKSFMKSLDEEAWLELLGDGVYGSPYGSKDADVKASYDAFIKDKTLKLRRSSLESKDGVEVFKISAGDLELCSVALKETESGAYGMARWKVEKNELTEELLDATNPLITVYAPEGTGFTVKGVSAEVKGEKVKNPGLSVFEKDDRTFIKYQFRAPFGEAKVAIVDGDGLSLHENEDAVYVIDTAYDTISQSISVPEGAEVYVNDVRLTTEYISQKGIEYTFLNPLEKDLENAPKSTVYTVKGLRKSPAIRVMYDGEELTGKENGENAVAYAFNGEGTSYRVQVPMGVTVKVNGIDVTGNEKYLVEKDVETSEVREYSSELVNPIKNMVYAFEGMLFVPEFEVLGADGKAYELEKSADGQYTCGAVSPSDELIPEYTELANNFTIAMMEYMFFGRDALTQTFPKALSLTRKNSKAYRSIVDSYSGVYWRRQHIITYNEMYVDNFKAYADNAFGCDVHYDVTGNAVSVTRVDYAKGVYRLLFVKGANGWEILEFALLDE